MCGIVGYWSRERPAEARLIEEMADRIRHRGPDGAGVWVDSRRQIGFGHRRLSIIDLSSAGHQPMVSHCGRFVVAFNGEIYNHLEMRRALERDFGAQAWRGRSDTETLLASLALRGLKATLEQANGMFAIALWDEVERKLHLARDRLGEKPLYYGRADGVFLFASELSALRAHPAWRGEIDPDALSAYFKLGYVPAPRTIYRSFSKLQPGRWLTVADAGERISPPEPYWDALSAARQGAATPLREDEVVDSLDAALRQAVASRMEADVPLGAFLSGGVDSSVVVALMQAQSARPVKTFSIGFREAAFDEAPHARAIAGHLGVDHTELYVSPQDALDVVPRLSSIWGEPFADPSQIPNLLISRLAREHVTVALSGDGGDEMLLGYGRYSTFLRMRKTFGRVPGPLRPLLGRLAAAPMTALTQGRQSALLRASSALRVDLLPLVQELLSAKDDHAFYDALRSHWLEPEGVLSEDVARQRASGAPAGEPAFADPRDLMMYLDQTGYLPDDILMKVDVSSMAASLEARAPLLDHRLIELCWRIPNDTKVKDGQTKWPLRQVLNRYVPRELHERPKQGFSVPIGEWLRGPLRDWAEDLLDERRMMEDGLLNVGAVRSRWQDHLDGVRPWPEHLWDVLLFQSWKRSNFDAPPPVAAPRSKLDAMTIGAS